MTIFTSLATFLAEMKKKCMKTLRAVDCKAGCVDVELPVKPVKLSCTSTKDESNFIASKTFPTVEKSYSFTPTTASMDSLVIDELVGDEAFEGSEEHDEVLPMKGCYTDLTLQVKNELDSHGSNTNLNNYASESKMETIKGLMRDALVANGYVSDPGMDQTVFGASPMLNKSKSSTKRSSSHSDHINLSGNDTGEFHHEDHSIPLSFRTSRSVDNLILQKHSSRKVLPPRSRNTWWNLCLWSGRSLYKPCASQHLALVHSTAYEEFGCSYDIHELAEKPDQMEEEITNRCIALSMHHSSNVRVSFWINSLEEGLYCPPDDDETCGMEDDDISSSHHMEMCESSENNHSHKTSRATEDTILSNNIIQSLNSFSLVAHFSGIGLKIIPSISAFGSLRSVSLSQNFIVHITPGCLPKNIHTLDLSRNKLSTIEGLRDLTKLRVLNLSHNRISRIGHGLSSCTVIKELYLTGNRISSVEGLHRLLKLSVLDLGFNKITTAKAFCQLVANYNSLFSLNLLGNPIQSNVGDDHIRKAVTSILPHIRYLNKQPIKQQRSRDVAANCVAHAAVGDGRWSSRRRPTRRLAQGLGSSAKGKNGNQSKRKHQYSSFVME